MHGDVGESPVATVHGRLGASARRGAGSRLTAATRRSLLDTRALEKLQMDFVILGWFSG